MGRIDVICENWKISRSKFYELVKRGEIRATRHPLTGRFTFNEEDIAAFGKKLQKDLKKIEI
jgi:excisionase family DNA binding protein